MVVEHIVIKGISVWVTIDQLLVYSSDWSRIETRQEFLCYFKLSEPTPISQGELFCDSENKPKLFDSVDNARKYASAELENRLK